MSKPPLLLLPLVLLGLLSLTTAEIKTLSITSDSRAMIVFQKFGFTPTGHVTISVHSVSVASSLLRPNEIDLAAGQDSADGHGPCGMDKTLHLDTPPLLMNATCLLSRVARDKMTERRSRVRIFSHFIAEMEDEKDDLWGQMDNIRVER